MQTIEGTPAVTTARQPVHPTIASFPIACLVGALLMDITYWRTVEMLWADLSAWLVSAAQFLAGSLQLAELLIFLAAGMTTDRHSLGCMRPETSSPWPSPRSTCSCTRAAPGPPSFRGGWRSQP